jgi:glucose/mannose-6-phosphate isomerase
MNFELDRSDMYSKIINMPNHISESYFFPIVHSAVPRASFPAIKQIIICGMGGSAISADIARSLFSTCVPISTVKDYNLPYVSEHTLAIIISYSGDTTETVQCLEKVIQKTPHVVVITSGGIIRKLVNNKLMWIEVPTGFPPRCAVAFMFFSLIKILEHFQIIPSQKEQVQKIVDNLTLRACSLSKEVDAQENEAIKSAESMLGRIPVIYSSYPLLRPVAYRWKCQINENAKYHAFSNTFPEMSHNEVVAYENISLCDRFIPIFLRTFNDDERYSASINRFQMLLNKHCGHLARNSQPYLEFYAVGESDLAKIFSLILLGDMISYYLGLLNKVDPTEINFIQIIKNTEN